MCKILLLSGALGVVDKTKQSRFLACLYLLFALYNLVMAIVHDQTWIIVAWAVLLALQLAASVANFIAIAKTIPMLLIPIICMTMLFCIINSVLSILAIIALVDPNSFYGNYVRERYTSKGTTDAEAASRVISFCTTSLVTSIIFLLVEVRAIFVHIASYRILLERRVETKNNQIPPYY